MTTHHFFSRSFAVLSLAAGIALTAAPSTARAETSQQIVVSDGTVDCPPCRLLQVADQNGLAFDDVAVEVQNGNRIVITAQIAVNATAGKPRLGSVVFSATTDAGFMDYTDDSCMLSAVSRQAGNQACDVLSRALRDAAAATTIPAPGPIVAPAPATTDGIIMRDGGVCDPIRHMGC